MGSRDLREAADEDLTKQGWRNREADEQGSN